MPDTDKTIRPLRAAQARKGLDLRESDAVLRFLYDWLQRPDFMVHRQ
ncbi:MAG: hypothetical protein ACO3BH_01455 [Quisquiliibacterium sp.]